MPALRRSSRNVSNTSEKPPATPPRIPKRKTKRKVTSPTKDEPPTPVKSAPASPRKAGRTPLADRQLGGETHGHSSAPLNASNSDSDDLLAGFGDQTVSATDDSFQAAGEVVHNAVSSWQAQSANPPAPRGDTLSSSLPPSSPPPPLSPFSESDLGYLAPLQDDGSEADTSSSDPFGFFAAQKKIQAHRKRVSPSDVLFAPTPATDSASNESPQASVSGGEAFATPSRARSHSSSLSDPPSEKRSVDKGKGVEDPHTTTRATTRPKRARIQSRSLVEEEESEDEPKRRLQGNQARKANSKPPGRTAKSKPAAKRAKRGKVTAVDDDETENANIPSENESDDESGSRDEREKAKLRRLAEFKELDDYKLEVEDVIIF